MKVTTRPARTPTKFAELTTASICVLAMAAAVATSTSYVLQPELAVVARDMGTSLPAIGVIAALPIGGYLVGLALLVPLADRVRPYRLISGQLAVLAAGLLLEAIAATPLILGAGLLVSGACASTGAQMSSLASRYSAANRRGRAVGTVTSGISAGIVLGRVLGGTLAGWCGWRLMLLIVAAACLALAAAAAAILPRTTMRPAQSYLTVIRSLPTLLRSSRQLRTSAVAGSLWFFAFSLVWVGLSLSLARPPADLSSARIGVYSLAGLLGVAATRCRAVLGPGRQPVRHPQHRPRPSGPVQQCLHGGVLRRRQRRHRRRGEPGRSGRMAWDRAHRQRRTRRCRRHRPALPPDPGCRPWTVPPVNSLVTRSWRADAARECR